MTRQHQAHLLPLAAIFILTTVYWLFAGAPILHYPQLLLGLALGSYFLYLDHIIFWLYISPHTEEARLAKIALFKYDFRSVWKLIESTRRAHTNLIFHHYFFQIVLALISIFVFTSSGSIFGKAFILALNIYLLVEEWLDYQQDRGRLQDWLFAREKKQLPMDYLGRYLAMFLTLIVIFTFLLIKSSS